jgi:hypothetical protein
LCYLAEVAFAFVYREVHVSNPVADNGVAKRKAGIFYDEEFKCELNLIIPAFYSDVCI